MPDDISGLTSEFERNMRIQFHEEFGPVGCDEKCPVCHPEVDPMFEQKKWWAKNGTVRECHRCDGVSYFVAGIGIWRDTCSCFGLKGCVNCGGSGQINPKMTRHGMAFDQCPCIPEHDTSLWGRIMGRCVAPIMRWRVTVNPTIPSDYGYATETFEGIELYRESTKTHYLKHLEPWHCMECLAANFPDNRCRCLDKIRWFEREPNERVADPHGTFWR